MNLKLKFITYSLLMSLFFLMACDKDLLERKSYSDVGSALMWTTDNLTEMGVNGVYNTLRISIGTGGASGYELYHFERLGITGQARGDDDFMQGKITPGSNLVSNIWKELYEGINRANDAIVNIPKVSPSSSERKGRFVAECKFLRAYFYFRLNQIFKGVPLYLEPMEVQTTNKGRETEERIWEAVILDLTDCINEQYFPMRYEAKSGDYGRVTKSAAYALRGKAYMYTKQYNLAAADFQKVKDAGHSLFQGGYKQLFTEANEQVPEMIFSIQHIGINGYGSTTQFYYGTRSSFGSCWNSFYVSPSVVEMYEYKDGTAFDWKKHIPEYYTLDVKDREVFFFRDTVGASKEIRTVTGAKLNALSEKARALYLPKGNEERLKKAYEDRDPRLAANVITPYSTYIGYLSGADHIVTFRWPYVNENPPTDDLRTDEIARCFYLYRKYVYEGGNQTPSRIYSPTDFPIIRYADVLLMWAEAINEQGFNTKAINLVNEVRNRAGVAPLQTTDPSRDTYVATQSALREKIRKERRLEFVGEGINVFDEMRWKTWKETVFFEGNGGKQMWGTNHYDYSWKGDYQYAWPIPLTEIQMNSNIKQNEGWIN